MPRVEELIDAAVAVVRRRAEDALRAEDPGNEYVEAYAVASELQEQGLITHEHVESPSPSWADAARKSIEGRVKRLLDAEAARPDARILRLSSRDHPRLPRLDGSSRGLYGQAVGYTTPEVFCLAEKAVVERRARAVADAEETDALLARADELGLPAPVERSIRTATFDLDGLRALVRALEASTIR